MTYNGILYSKKKRMIYFSMQQYGPISFWKGSIKAKHKTVHSMVPTLQSSKSSKLIYDVKSQDGSYPLQGAGGTGQGYEGGTRVIQ